MALRAPLRVFSWLFVSLLVLLWFGVGWAHGVEVCDLSSGWLHMVWFHVLLQPSVCAQTHGFRLACRGKYMLLQGCHSATHTLKDPQGLN